MTDFRSTAYDPRFDPRYVRAQSDAMVGPIIVYLGLILTLFTGGLSFVAAMIMAYVLKSEAGPAGWSHYVYAIRTGWWWLAASALAIVVCIVSIPLMLVLIGFPLIVVAGLVLVAAKVWFVVRCVVGIAKAADGRPVASPRAYLI